MEEDIAAVSGRTLRRKRSKNVTSKMMAKFEPPVKEERTRDWSRQRSGRST